MKGQTHLLGLHCCSCPNCGQRLLNAATPEGHGQGAAPPEQRRAADAQLAAKNTSVLSPAQEHPGCKEQRPGVAPSALLTPSKTAVTILDQIPIKIQ